MTTVPLHRRLQLFILLFGVILLAIIGTVIYPSVRDILELQTEINNTEAFLESQYQKTRRIQRTVQNVDALVSSTAAFTALTVSQGSELAIIQRFESLAAQHGITQTFSVTYTTAPNEQTRLPYYQFTFLHHGRMEDHIALLHDMLTLPYVVDIDSIRFEKRNSQSGRSSTDTVHETSMQFTARVYAK